jgi:hypothetical protein
MSAVPPPLPPARPGPPPWARPATIIVAGVALLAGAVILFSFNPSSEAFFPRCPLYSTTGLYCPGCGSTRCLHHLSHGRISTALRYNPIVPAFLVYLAVAGVVKGLRRAGVRVPWPSKPLPAKWIWAIFAAILLYGVLRNIPAEPFRSLAPPK